MSNGEMKMYPLKRSKADREAEQDRWNQTMDMPDGITVHLDHHHLDKMGLGGSLNAGDEVHFRGRGKVESAQSMSDGAGERHTARLVLTHAGAVGAGEEGDEAMTDEAGEAGPGDRGGSIRARAADKIDRRADIERAYEERRAADEAKGKIW